MRIKKFINIISLTLFLILVTINNVFASEWMPDELETNEMIEKGNVIKVFLIIIASTIFVISMIIMSTIVTGRKKVDNEKDNSIDYNNYLENIIEKRKFIGKLTISIVCLLPIFYIMLVLYSNMTNHIIIG